MSESVEHEQLVGLFRNRKELVRELLEPLGVQVVGETDDEPDESELNQARPLLARADLLQLYKVGDEVQMVVVVEVQLGRDTDKRRSWPLYWAIAKSRHRCPVRVLVVAPDPAVARWCKAPIDLDGHGRFEPLVLGPSEIARPQSRSEPPERLLLAVAAHPDLEAAKLALEAGDRLPSEDQAEYTDILLSLLPEDVAEEIYAMFTTKPRQPVSRFGKEHYGKGLEEGQRALLKRMLTRRFGELPSEVLDRLEGATLDQLASLSDRLLEAETLKQVFADES